jgi:DNA-binding transcriptional LysR family regulator
MESASLEMVRSLVAHGHGLSLLTTRPSRDVSYDGQRLVCKPLSAKVAPQRLVLAASASMPLSPAAEAFLLIAREHLAKKS